jgi:hypothetical protein
MTNSFLLWVVTIIYLVQAGICGWHHQWAQMLILIGYTIATAGLIWSMEQ